VGSQTASVVVVLLLVPAFLVLSGWITMLIAQNKGHDRGRAFRAGLFLGVLAIAVYLILPERSSAEATERQALALSRGQCPKCKAETQIFEGFCTVCGTRVEKLPDAGTSLGVTVSGAAGKGASPAADEHATGAPAGRPAAAAGSPGGDPGGAISEELCPGCGRTTRFFEGFCTSCGTRSESAAEITAVPESIAGMEPAAGAVEVQRCPQCGTPSRFEEGYCTECGTRLSPPAG